MMLSPPPMFSGDLHYAVSLLARAAHYYRTVLLLADEADDDKPDSASPYREMLDVSDAVIDAWRKQLGQDLEQS